MLTTKKINEILNVTESYQAPEALLKIMLDENKRQSLFGKFLAQESNLDYEWFQSYFESEHADRKVKKQDFTPNSVSNLGAKILGASKSYFEATAGTGGMMIQFWRNNKDATYDLEELSDRAIPFLLFNMAIRGISGSVKHGDSLTGEFKEYYEVINRGKFSEIVQLNKEQECRNVKSVLMNPPYSAAWSADKKFETDTRFQDFGKLAPKSKADFAFLLHGFSKLDEGGTMAVVLPHGVLFRGAAEGIIRTTLLEMGAIESIIGLPEKLFFGTQIPTVLIILKKSRTDKSVHFIDASQDFEKGKNQNVIKSEHIDKILSAYERRENIEKYAHVASFEEIQSNDYNLNIPRYVDTFEEEEPIDFMELSNELVTLNSEIAQAEQEFLKMLGELAITDESKDLIEATKKIFQSNLNDIDEPSVSAKKILPPESQKHFDQLDLFSF